MIANMYLAFVDPSLKNIRLATKTPRYHHLLNKHYLSNVNFWRAVLSDFFSANKKRGRKNIQLMAISPFMLEVPTSLEEQTCPLDLKISDISRYWKGGPYTHQTNTFVADCGNWPRTGVGSARACRIVRGWISDFLPQ